MNPTRVSRDRPTRDGLAPGTHVDLHELWDAAGRPPGRSPRQWRRSTLGQSAVALLAARRGVGPDAAFGDPGGPGARIPADVAIAVAYAATLVPEVVEAGLAALDRDDSAAVRGLLEG